MYHSQPPDDNHDSLTLLLQTIMLNAIDVFTEAKPNYYPPPPQSDSCYKYLLFYQFITEQTRNPKQAKL